jgi:acetamidase/formamidase
MSTVSTEHRIGRDQIHMFFDPHEEPRLTVPSGAGVLVETEDAHMGSIRTAEDGYKSLGEVFERLGGANPVTGPIFVDGVEAGDCLAVTITDIVPGVVQGQGYTVLTPGLGGLVSDYSLQPSLAPRTVICPIEDGVVKFPSQGGTIEIPTSPFLGTIGVAPAQERRLAFVQGAEFGGNTDLPLHGIGSTLVFRANVPGGLLSLGDAHAVQGHGEISGAAIECQADVTLRVERIPAADAEYVGLPQVNTDEFIGSVAGFAGVHLGDVVRAAYIDVIRRLETFYGMEMEEAYLLVCQTARVHVGQIVDPLYSAAVTIDRRFLPSR